jgi:hypothetical protein
MVSGALFYFFAQSISVKTYSKNIFNETLSQMSFNVAALIVGINGVAQWGLDGGRMMMYARKGMTLLVPWRCWRLAWQDHCLNPCPQDWSAEDGGVNYCSVGHSALSGSTGLVCAPACLQAVW